jgi:hypothetical protein
VQLVLFGLKKTNKKLIMLENSDILYKQEYLEFHTLSTELKTYSQIANEAHWQDVRERAAIAAMQTLIRERYCDSSCQSIAIDALDYADALIEQLKKSKQ